MANKVDIVVTASDQASSTLKGIGGALDGLGAMGKIAAAGFAALAAGVAAAGAAIGYFVSAAADAEESQARFNSMVGSSKLADYTDEMQKMANTLSQVTRFEDENILEAEGMLSLYQNIGQDIFPQVIETALDLAEVLKTDATGGAETLGRALSDIAEGSLGMLARSRLITKEQQAMAEEMAKAGDEAGAQALILDILNGKIGNLAETMGATLKGNMEIFKNNLGNMAETLGDKFLPLLAPLVERLSKLASQVFPAISYAMDKYVVPLFKAGVDWLMRFIDGIDISKLNQFVINLKGFNLKNINWDGIRESLNNIDWKAVSETLIEKINGIDWNLIGSTLGELLKTAMSVAIDIASEVDWQGLFKSLGKALADFATGLGGGSMDEFIAVWSGNFEQLYTIFDTAAEIVGNKIRVFINIGRGVVEGLKAGVSLGWSSFISWIATKMGEIAMVYNRVVTLLALRIEDFFSLGQNIVNGLKMGIKSAWDAFVGWFVGLINQIIDSALAALGISSPSKVFAGIGKNIMAGLAEGIGEGATIPINTMMGTFPRLAGATAGGGGMGAGNQYHTHNYYGARIMLELGAENQILARLTE